MKMRYYDPFHIGKALTGVLNQMESDGVLNESTTIDQVSNYAGSHIKIQEVEPEKENIIYLKETK